MGQSMARVNQTINPFIATNTTRPNPTSERARTVGNTASFGGEEGVASGANQRNPSGAVGSFFGEHFLMGGERYDVAKPDTTTFLFGDHSDLELLGNKPVKFPYSINKGVADSVNVLNSLVNVRRDSVKFIRAECSRSASLAYKLGFVFDCDVPCYIQIHFCAREVVDTDYIQIVSKYPSIDSSQKFHFGAGPAQPFDKFTFKSHRYDLKMLHYEGGQYFPVVIEIRTADEEGKFSEQVQTTLCSIERSADQASTIILKPLKQKLIVNGVTYLMQEIYGLENKEPNLQSMDENGSECIICMANPRDTVILPCRHLCICNGCAETLRYKLNNCPICRSPFKALLKLKTVRLMMGSLNAAGAVRLRQEALTLMEALNGPYQNSEHPQQKISVSLRCKKDLEGEKDIISAASYQRSASRNLSFVERMKKKEVLPFCRNANTDSIHAEQIELEHIQPQQKKSFESSLVRMSGNSITRAQPAASSSQSSSGAAISCNLSSSRSSRTASGSVECERLPLSQTLEISEAPSTDSADNQQFAAETSSKTGSRSRKEEEDHATLVRVASQQSTMDGSVMVVDKALEESKDSALIKSK